MALILPLVLLPLLVFPVSAAPREALGRGVAQASGADSTALVREASERQQQFERFRVERIPLSQ